MKKERIKKSHKYSSKRIKNYQNNKRLKVKRRFKHREKV